MTNPLDFFKQTYDIVPDWVEKMHQYSPEALQHYTNLRGSILKDGALSRKDKELILVGINAARRYEKSMIFHTKGAVDAGASVEEIAEVLLACILSRGLPAWLVGVKSIEYAIDYIGEKAKEFDKHYLIMPEKKENIDECIKYYKQAQGELPQWVHDMMDYNEEALLHYTNLRNQALSEGVVSRKLKELVLVGINVAERYPEGVKIHTEGAKRCGATNEELADCHLTAVLTAGIPAWFEGSEFL